MPPWVHLKAWRNPKQLKRRPKGRCSRIRQWWTLLWDVPKAKLGNPTRRVRRIRGRASYHELFSLAAGCYERRFTSHLSRPARFIPGRTNCWGCRTAGSIAFAPIRIGIAPPPYPCNGSTRAPGKEIGLARFPIAVPRKDSCCPSTSPIKEPSSCSRAGGPDRFPACPNALPPWNPCTPVPPVGCPKIPETADPIAGPNNALMPQPPFPLAQLLDIGFYR